MTADNDVKFTGNVTREPQLRFTASGHGVANFGIAVNRSWKDRDDEWQEETMFIDVTCWGQLAENVADTPKGARVMVVGRLEQQSWENEDGDKRTKHAVVADDVGRSMKFGTVDKFSKNEKKGGSKPRRQDDDDSDPFLD